MIQRQTIQRIYSLIKRKSLYINSIAFIFLIITSCSGIKELQVEIPKKGKKELPPAIQSLTLVNRTPIFLFSDIKSDSLQQIFLNHHYNLDTVIYDLTACDTTLKALGNLLFESDRYDFVIPENRFLLKDNTFFSPSLEWSEVSRLCKTFKTDAVLSLEHFKTRVITSLAKEKFIDPYRNSEVTASFARIIISCEAFFKVYDPKQRKVVLQELVKDTLVWEDADLITRQLLERFTPVKNALAESGISLALELADQISTTWIPDTRFYFGAGNKKMKDASAFVKSGDWQQAIQIWNNISETTRSKSAKSKAQYNLALANEMDNNFDNALKWALKSYKTHFRTITYNYLELLKKRKNEIEK